MLPRHTGQIERLRGSRAVRERRHPAEESRAVLIARNVPHERVSDAAAALEEDAVEIDDEPVDNEDEGAIGTAGGFGRATGDVDRLTGEPIGTEHPRHARAYRAR